jgi:hypothetical protein
MGKDTGGLVHKIGDFVNRSEAAEIVVKPEKSSNVGIIEI